MFNDSMPYVIFPNVTITRKHVSSKGTKCTTLGWIGGEKVVYDAGLFETVEEGQVHTIQGNINGDFVKNCSIVAEGKTSRRRSSVEA